MVAPFLALPQDMKAYFQKFFSQKVCVSPFSYLIPLLHSLSSYLMSKLVQLVSLFQFSVKVFNWYLTVSFLSAIFVNYDILSQDT